MNFFVSVASVPGVGLVHPGDILKNPLTREKQLVEGILSHGSSVIIAFVGGGMLEITSGNAMLYQPPKAPDEPGEIVTESPRINVSVTDLGDSGTDNSLSEKTKLQDHEPAVKKTGTRARKKKGTRAPGESNGW